MVGICGTGMGSLALLLKEAGHHVTGSDENVYPPMSTQLENAGIEIIKDYQRSTINDQLDLIIIGNVISRGNEEAEAVIESKIDYMSMPEALNQFFIKDKHSIVIAGTHGKTTTSTLCAWMLESAGLKPGFMIGGVGLNLGISARIAKGDYFVVEGDEYDTAFFDKGPKFLHYSPKSVILGPIEFDHADIYKNLDHVMGSFEKLVNIIPKDGLLVACADSENTMKIAAKAKCRVVEYSFSRFSRFSRSSRSNGLLFGRHNRQNIAGVVTLLTELGIDQEKIKKGLETFKGIKRRQEIVGEVNGITIIDDFAHHPTSVKETIQSIRDRFPEKRIWAIFEPRSNTSQRKVFQKEFVDAFKKADISIIAGLHRPERLAPSERLDPQKLVQEIGNGARYMPKVDEIIDFITQGAKSGDVILIMSNGSFDGIHTRLLKRLSQS